MMSERLCSIAVLGGLIWCLDEAVFLLFGFRAINELQRSGFACFSSGTSEVRAVRGVHLGAAYTHL